MTDLRDDLIRQMPCTVHALAIYDQIEDKFRAVREQFAQVQRDRATAEEQLKAATQRVIRLENGLRQLLTANIPEALKDRIREVLGE